MEKKEIKQELIQIISGLLNVEPGEIRDDQDMLQEYGIDSITLVVLICAIEERFQIKVEDYKDLYQNKTIVELTDWMYGVTTQQGGYDRFSL